MIRNASTVAQVSDLSVQIIHTRSRAHATLSINGRTYTMDEFNISYKFSITKENRRTESIASDRGRVAQAVEADGPWQRSTTHCFIGFSTVT